MKRIKEIFENMGMIEFKGKKRIKGAERLTTPKPLKGLKIVPSKNSKRYKNFIVVETNANKILNSKFYNYLFDKKTGYMAQWGETMNDDPLRAPAPVLADIEIVASCKGPGGKLCPFCYKNNTPGYNYMPFEIYKKIFDKLPKSLTQIAFGTDADLSVNPDIWKIIDYTKEKGVIPNVTVADITKETAEKLATKMGAVAVSWYGIHSDKKYCYDSIKFLTDAGLDQVNMHFMLSQETYPFIDELIKDIKNDPRLKKLNAVVFLSLKQKGRGKTFKGCSVKQFQNVIEKMLKNNIPFGFDSCSAIKFLQGVKNLVDEKTYKKYKDMSEPCESFSQSIYINEHGIVFPCSFMENEIWYQGNKKSWDLKSDEIKDDIDFIEKVWNSPEAIWFSYNAKVCQGCGQGCQYYNV